MAQIPIVFDNVAADPIGQRYLPIDAYLTMVEAPVLCINQRFKANAIIMNAEGKQLIITLFADAPADLAAARFMVMQQNQPIGGRIIRISNARKHDYYGSCNIMVNNALTSVNTAPNQNNANQAIINFINNNNITTLH
jgi:hypothetical protein